MIRALISDFGGVLTSPLLGAFTGYAADSGIPVEALGQAIFAIAQRTGANPLFDLETGHVTEEEFLTSLEGELARALGRQVSLHGFAEGYFAHLHPNERLIAYLRELPARGLRLALCTNNVREWEPLWRAKLPVDEIFEVVVDSGFVGHRKPDPEIYAITLDRLGLDAGDCLFLDDVEINCTAARELGIRAVWFRDTEQAIADLERELA